ncbi:MAG: class I SAM-dependent methyltransferase [Candidatus Hodarchaeota archaeon]
MGILNSFFDIFGKKYCNLKSKREFLRRKFQLINERPIEYRFVFKILTEISPKKILDVGPGMSSLPHLMSNCGFLVTAIDNIYEYWSRRVFNRHYYIIQDDITKTKLKSKFDLITCISVLEHIKNFESAINNMAKLLNDNGHLITTFPYNEENYIDNIYKKEGAGYGQDKKYICQIFSRKELNNWQDTNNIRIIKQEYWQVFKGEFWTFGNRITPARKVKKEEKHHLTCILFQKY